MVQKSYTILWICGLILAAAVGFFASAVIFCNEKPLPPAAPAAQEQFQNGPQQPQDFGMNHPKGRNMAHMMDSALGLSEDQIKILHENGHKRDSVHRAIHRQIKETEATLHQLLGEEKIDEASLQSVRQKLLQLNEERLNQRIEDVKLFKKVLNAEQLQKFSQLKFTFESKMPRGEKQGHPNSQMKGPQGPHQGPHMNHMAPPHRDEAHKMPPRE